MWYHHGLHRYAPLQALIGNPICYKIIKKRHRFGVAAFLYVIHFEYFYFFVIFAITLNQQIEL